MKNQNDLIFSIVAFVVFLIVLGVCWGTQPQPTKPAPPAQVNTSAPKTPTGVVPVMANALPGASSSGGGGGAAGMGGSSGPASMSFNSGAAANGAKIPGMGGAAGSMKGMGR